ncbi:putative FKBP-type peptidyl-prolyl cis-trans isomerase [compost metagenome]
MKINKQGRLQMVVPPELAYGEEGSTPDIPPNATMVYDIQVMDVNPQAKTH